MKNKILKAMLGLAVLSVMGCGEANTHIDRISSKIKYFDKDNETISEIKNNEYNTYIGTFKINSKEGGSKLSLTNTSDAVESYNGYLTLENNSADNKLSLRYKYIYLTKNNAKQANEILSKDKIVEIEKSKVSYVDKNTLKIDNIQIPNYKEANNVTKTSYNVQMKKIFDRVGDINETNTIEIDKTTNKGMYYLIRPGGPLCDVACQDESCTPNKGSAGRCSEIDPMFKFIGIYEVENIISGCTGENLDLSTIPNKGLVEATVTLEPSGNVLLTVRMNIDLPQDKIEGCKDLLNSEYNKATKNDKSHRFYFDKQYYIDLTKFDGLTAIFPAVGLNSIEGDYFNVNFHTKDQVNKGDFTELKINEKPFKLKLKISENLNLNDAPTLKNENLITQ